MGRENLTQLLSQLSVQSTKDDSAKVEEICRQLLDNGCDNPGPVLKSCLVAVIKQDKYKMGLDLIRQHKKTNDKFGDQFLLETLYIYYKLNKKQEFENLYFKIRPNLLESCDTPRGILHVRAQFCYKQGLYEEAYKIYNLLASNNEDMIDNTLELACNQRVPLSVAPHMKDESTPLIKVDEATYDLLFNDSMVSSASGEYEHAIELLEKAHEMATQEGLESDIEAIELQLAFVLQMQGDNKRSHAVLDQLLKKDNDSPFSLLAKINQKSFIDYSKYTDNLNIIIRELDFKKLDSINHKQFTHEQWSIINRNCLFLHLFNNNSIQYGSGILSRTLHNYRKFVNDISLESYRTQSKKLYHHAVKMINSGIDGSVIGFLLLSVQLLVVEKQWHNAIGLCELFLNQLWNSPVRKNAEQHHTICYVLFELYKITGRDHSKSILLKKLQDEQKSVSKDVAFWKHVGLQHLSLGNAKEARKLLKQVSVYDDDNAIKKVLSDEALNLEESVEITRDIDIQSLLELGIQPLESSSKVESRKGISKIQKKRILSKNKKKKEQRVKKFLENHEISKNVDPERWIPLKDRSSYRPKKKQSLTKQTQGGAMNKKAEQALDITKKPNKPSSINRKKKGRK